MNSFTRMSCHASLFNRFIHASYPYWIVPVIVDVPERPGRMNPVLFVCGSATVRTQIVTVLNLNQRVQIRQIILRKQIFERSAKHGLLCQIQSRHLNVFNGKFRKPWLGAKGHVSVITKVASARELGYDWGRSAMSTPSRPIKDRPLLTVISCFENIICYYSGY